MFFFMSFLDLRTVGPIQKPTPTVWFWMSLIAMTRLRETIGNLGKETIAQGSEVATLKANTQDIMTQVCSRTTNFREKP